MRLFCPFASRVGRFARFSFVTVFENDSIAMMGGALQSARVGGGGLQPDQLPGDTARVLLMGLARLNGTLDTSTTPSIALALSPFPISLPFSFQLLPAGARADTGELKLGLELPLGRILGLGGECFVCAEGECRGHSTVSVTCGKLLTKRMANVCQQEDV